MSTATTTPAQMHTVTLSARELRLVRNLVEHAFAQCSVADMRRVIDLDRLSQVIDEALRDE